MNMIKKPFKKDITTKIKDNFIVNEAKYYIKLYSRKIAAAKRAFIETKIE